MPYRDRHDPRIRDASTRHYDNHKDEYIARNLVRKMNLKALMIQLRSNPCMDCGGTFRTCAMDFDHRDPTTKRWMPSHLPGHGSLRLMQEELAKCDLVCSNCHRVREETRREVRRAAKAAATDRSATREESPPTLF
jgi:hypothetical protein